MRLFGNICLLGGLLVMFASPFIYIAWKVPYLGLIGAFVMFFGAGIIRTLNKQQNS
jgi:hypothetical protein